MIGIVDYNAGNITSVEHALSFLQCPYLISKKPRDLQNASALIFPGVGEASYAMNQLKASGFDLFLKDFCAGKPLLGICLGSQIVRSFRRNDTLSWSYKGYPPLSSYQRKGITDSSLNTSYGME